VAKAECRGATLSSLKMGSFGPVCIWLAAFRLSVISGDAHKSPIDGQTRRPYS